MLIQITNIPELVDIFIIQGRDDNMTFLKKGELERAIIIWTRLICKEVLEF